MSFNHYYQSGLTAQRQLGKRFDERGPVNNSVSRFFQISIWIPAALLLSLPFLEVWSRGKASLEDALVTFGLWFGVLAYLTFAVWASCYIKKKSEPAIVRLAWFAPLIFIPFYGVPWVAYRLLHVAMGDVSGFAMAVLWVAFSPCIVVAGYVFVAFTLVIYEVFLKSANSGRER